MEDIYFTVKTISQDGLDTIAYDNNFYIQNGILYYLDEKLSRDVEDPLYIANRIIEYCHDTVLEITDGDDNIIYKNEEFDEDDDLFESLNESLEKFIESNLPDIQKLDIICINRTFNFESSNYIGRKNGKWGIYITKFEYGEHNYYIKSPEFNTPKEALQWFADKLLDDCGEEKLYYAIKTGNLNIVNDDLKAMLGITKMTEGEVVSFTDYKRKKQNDQFLKDNEEELNKLMENKIFVDINGIDIIWAEGRNDGVNCFKDGEKLSYEEFQKRAYEYSYVLKDRVGVDKVKITIYFTINGEEDRYNTMIYIGDDKNLEFKDVNLQRVLSRAWKEYFDGKEIIIRNAILPEDVDFNNLKYAQLEKEEPEQEPLPDYVKDYTKDPQDVAVGDILTCSWGYSMSLVDYYKVIERKAKSIKLAKLQNKILTGGGYSGTCMPSEEIKRDQYVDGKLFRIGCKWSKDVVCQINGHSVYYWDGKPDDYDHMD